MRLQAKFLGLLTTLGEFIYFSFPSGSRLKCPFSLSSLPDQRPGRQLEGVGTQRPVPGCPPGGTMVHQVLCSLVRLLQENGAGVGSGGPGPL